MAISRCSKDGCGSTVFELNTIEPRDSWFKLTAIQCLLRGAVVSVMDYTNIGADLGVAKDEIQKLTQEFSNLQSIEHNIDQNIVRAGAQPVTVHA